MENNIKLNKKLLIFSLIIVIVVVCVLSNNKNLNEEFNNVKDEVEKLFDNNSFITVPSNTYNDYNLTYGELKWEGMENISKFMKLKNKSKKTFIDLGSGNGRTLAYAVLNGFEEAKGTELVKARHDYAMNMRKKLDSYMRDKIKLSNEDMFKLDPSYFPPGSVIFISNLLFPKETTQKLIKFLGENTPSDVIVILSSIPNDLGQFKLIEKLDLPMSWATDSSCYVLSK